MRHPITHSTHTIFHITYSKATKHYGRTRPPTVTNYPPVAARSTVDPTRAKFTPPPPTFQSNLPRQSATIRSDVTNRPADGRWRRLQLFYATFSSFLGKHTASLVSTMFRRPHKSVTARLRNRRRRHLLQSHHQRCPAIYPSTSTPEPSTITMTPTLTTSTIRTRRPTRQSPTPSPSPEGQPAPPTPLHPTLITIPTTMQTSHR